jgi:tRNA-dihydrouridine synthase A
MQINNNIEVSLKCRIGLGKNFNYDFFEEFISEVVKSEIKIIYVHARNAILNGISPKGNRDVPPLNYDFVRKIKRKYPNIFFVLNGGINNLEKALDLSKEFDGVMVGRLIQKNPFCLSKIDELFFNSSQKVLINENIIYQYFKYIRPKLGKDSIFRLLSPLLQIFFGIPNSKEFKSKIHYNMEKNKIDILERLIIEFVNKQKLLIN